MPQSLQDAGVIAPSRDDLANALEVLNASLDSGLVREMIQEVSPTRKRIDDRDHEDVLEKCTEVIDQLKNELEEARLRNAELDETIASLREDIEVERETIRNHKRLEDKLKKDYDRRIRELEDALNERDRELENMTSYCEKRVTGLKQQVKEASSMGHSVATDSETSDLREQLRSRDSEAQHIIDSYEKQLSLLKAQLKSNEEMIQRFVRVRDPAPTVVSGSKWDSHQRKGTHIPFSKLV
jgi:chromosome segregation ATPase